MKIPYDEISMAFSFVSSGSEYDHMAVLSKETGKIYYRSDFDDELDEFPDDVDTSDQYIAIPHKNELDLGQRLVWDFVGRRLPDRFGEVEGFFRRRGAYARLKELLASKDLLDEWYAFENEREESALKEWCADNGIEVVDTGPEAIE